MQQPMMTEERLAVAAVEIRRNGQVYLPGGEAAVPVDALAYAELLAVKGIAPTPWEALPVATSSTTLPALIVPTVPPRERGRRGEIDAEAQSIATSGSGIDPTNG